jgi:Abnormal spindle-like microcephaly-assoc'd, ASPM-SPD-2-Hydin
MSLVRSRVPWLRIPAPEGTGAGHRPTTRRARWFAAGTAAALGAGLSLAVVAAPAQAALSPTVGPVDGVTSFPAFYQDTAGQRLEPCLDGPPICFAAASDLTAPDGEAFYNNAGATLTLKNAGKATLTLALEAAYAGADSGQEITFGRIRFTANKGLTPGATYKVTHPYGVDSFVAASPKGTTGALTGAVAANAGTEDIGALGPCLGPNAHAAGGSCDFAEATTGRVGPFLKWDPAVAPAAPAGYLGDNATPHRITGAGAAPAANVFRIEGPGVNPGASDACPTVSGLVSDCLETNLFTVEGKIAGPVMSTPTRPAFGSQQLGTTSAAQTVNVKNIGQNALVLNTVTLDPATGNPEDFKVSAGTCTTGLSLARDGSCNLSVRFTPTATVGTRTATVLVTHNGLRSPEKIQLTGSAAAVDTAPAVTFGPASLTFADQRLGTKSAGQDVTITNTGTADLNVSKVALGGANATDFTTSNDCVGVSVAPGGTCTVTARFTPQQTAGAKTATVTITDDAPLSPRTVALSGKATAGLVDVGPVDTTTNFPSSYTDVNGTKLQMCLDGPPNCLTAAADLVAPAGEGFYNNATAKLTTRNNGKAVMVLSLEGAYAGSTAGQEVVFSRIRFTDSGGLVPNAVYTVTHPFGVDDYKANGSGQIVKNQGTQDIGGLGPCSATAHNPGGACDFATAMTGRFGPFIQWAPNAANLADVPPAGFVGDAATDHKVVGSPLNTNFVRIQGPLVNPTPLVDKCPTVDGAFSDCTETDLFVVAGKLAP